MYFKTIPIKVRYIDSYDLDTVLGCLCKYFIIDSMSIRKRGGR